MFQDLLVHEAVVYRRTGDKDRFGQPAKNEREWARFPCRVTNASGGEQNTERSHDVVVTRHTVFADRGADVREDDLVTVLGAQKEEIVPLGAVTLKKQPYDMTESHHVEFEITCQRQTR